MKTLLSRLVRETALIELLLEDIARIEPIKGRAEYLPLTRRLERGRILMRLAAPSFEGTFAEVQRHLHRASFFFNRRCRKYGKPDLLPAELGAQIETFLDKPRMHAPPALNSRMSLPFAIDETDRKKYVKLGWYYVYLLALLPPGLRADAFTCQPDDNVLKHFRLVRREYAEAHSRLIEGTLRYVLRIATSYMGRGLSYLDLVQEGYFGLQHAASRFVEHEGAHFQQYASHWIQQRMMRAIAERSNLIRLPVHRSEQLRQLKRLEREYENDLVFNPHARDPEIMQRMGLFSSTEPEDGNDRRATRAVLRLKQLRSHDARHYPIDQFVELLVDENSPEEQSDKQILRLIVDELLEKLNERERAVVQMRTGLAEGEPKTLEQIAQRYGLTRERIRQIESRAYRRLQGPTSKFRLANTFPEPDHCSVSANDHLRRSLFEKISRLEMREALRPDMTWRARFWIEQRLKRRTWHGRTRVTGTRRGPDRAALFERVLREAGQPLHYVEIHRRVLALLPPPEHFSKEVAYAKLFYNNRFHTLGGGVFGLASWQDMAHQTKKG